jgi:hypothetical protein
MFCLNSDVITVPIVIGFIHRGRHAEVNRRGTVCGEMDRLRPWHRSVAGLSLPNPVVDALPFPTVA